MITLNNELLSVGIAKTGAEVKSVRYLPTQTEMMWQGNPAFWGRTSPVLFPIVGRLHQNRLLVNDNAFTLTQHGFARDEDFVITKQQDDMVHFTLQSNTHTRALYPYDFTLEIIYTLSGNSLNVDWHVCNTGAETMYFGIGAHPGFNLPGGMRQYEIVFEKPESASTVLLQDGLLTTYVKPLLNNAVVLPLHPDLFAADALVFKSIQSEKLLLRNRQTGYSVEVSWKNFPYLGIWSAKGCDAFVCIEPWCGHADPEGGHTDISSKPGMQVLNPGELFIRQYCMRFQGA